VRDAYMSRRQYLVFDGNPPVNDEFDVFEEDE
jgi:phospholipid-binding lipoprotein MlaA